MLAYRDFEVESNRKIFKLQILMNTWVGYQILTWVFIWTQLVKNIKMLRISETIKMLS